MKDYAKNNFYKEFNRRNVTSNDFTDFVKATGENSGFYELCAVFLDIALNAQTCKDGTVIFSEQDIAIAIKETLKYINEHNILDNSGLLDIIYEHHTYAIRKNEKRPITGIVWETDSTRCGRIGVLYNFSKIPLNIWSKIKDEIFRNSNEQNRMK